MAFIEGRERAMNIFSILIRKRHLYQFGSRRDMRVLAIWKYGAARMLWGTMAPTRNDSGEYSGGRGAFRDYDAFWKVCKRELIDYGKVDGGEYYLKEDYPFKPLNS